MTKEPQTPRIRDRRALLVALVVAALHTVFRVWAVLAPGMGGPSAEDERRFHLPVVRAFAEAWPSPDLADYAAASTPGHHLALAWLRSFGAVNDDALRLVSGVPVTLLLALLSWWCVRRAGMAVGVALVLPLACSVHSVSFATLVVPESTSWLLVGALLLLALRERFGVRTMVVAGVLLALAVFVRQITLWLAAPLWIAAWTSIDADDDSGGLPVSEVGRRLPGTALMALLTVPALLALAYFVRLWGGLVPPGFQSAQAASALDGAIVNEGLSPAAPAFILALLGIIGAFTAPVLWRTARDSGARCLRWGLIGGALGLLCAVVPATGYSIESGRWGGIWNAGLHVPDIAGRSPVIAALAAGGGAYFGAFVWSLVGARTRWIVLAALLGVMAAHAAGAQLFQRYIEPFVLIFVAACCAHALERASARPARWALVPLGLLTLAQLALTASRIGA